MREGIYTATHATRSVYKYGSETVYAYNGWLVTVVEI